MSNEVKVRGYIVAKSAAYLRTLVGDAEARRIFEGLSPGLSQALGEVKPAEWMPAAYSSEILRNIALLSKGNDDHARDELVKCGRYIANEATNTFLKLLMRVLTPNMFAKKLPSFWSRDATAGKYDVDVTEDKIVCRLSDMDAFENIAPISVGYVSFALESMGKTIKQSNLHGWSLKNPAPSEMWFELYWER
jgi:hypothetical protein